MAMETVDYAAVLADLEAKRAALDSAIAAVRQLLNLGTEQGSSGSPGQQKREQVVRFDSFFQMTVPDAIRKFLTITTQPQTLSEITKALEQGGLKTTSKNLMGIVGPTLSRMKKAGDVLPIQGKWGLAEWYPAARKEVAKSARAKRGRPKKPKGKLNADFKTSSSKPTSEQIDQIKRLNASGKKLSEIAKEVGLHHFTVMRVIKAA
jgi:hypothetical protein